MESELQERERERVNGICCNINALHKMILIGDNSTYDKVDITPLMLRNNGVDSLFRNVCNSLYSLSVSILDFLVFL